MEVLNENAALLCNNEVLSLLNDIQAGRQGRKKPSKHDQNLATVTYSTSKYLEKTPCANQNKLIIDRFVTLIQPFKLKKAEILQLLNLRPTTVVEIQLIVEESEERLTEEQIEELLQIISSVLPESNVAS